MKISLLNCRITIQKSTVTVDAIGNHLNTWANYYSCYAKISGEGGAEVNDAGQIISSKRADFTVRYSSETAAVNPEGYRLTVGNRIYNIIAVDTLSNRHKSLKYICEEVRR